MMEPAISNNRSVEASMTANAASRDSSCRRRETTRQASSKRLMLASITGNAPALKFPSKSSRAALPATHTMALKKTSTAKGAGPMRNASRVTGRNNPRRNPAETLATSDDINWGTPLGKRILREVAREGGG